MHESGVDLEFDLIEDHQVTELKNCFTLESMPSAHFDAGSGGKSQLMDTNIRIKPDPDTMLSTSLPATSSSYLMRTNFKQQLQKEHLMQLEKAQNAIKSMSVESNAMSIPGEKSPAHNNMPTDVPPNILKVRTKLENPTSYHLKQQQKKQLKEYYNTQQRLSFRPALPLDTSNQRTFDQFNFNNVASPATSDVADSSVASNEVDSLLEDFFGQVDTVSEDLNMFGDGLPFSTTLPTNTGLMDLYAPDLCGEQTYDKTALQISASCPAKVKREAPTSPCDSQIFVKDRQKKDNHNMIERRRRYNINDRIRELGTLIPKSDSDSKQNKGTILKSSVDYIKRLLRERERFKGVDSQNKALEEKNKQLTLRVQELELILRASNIPTQLPSPTLTSNLRLSAGLNLANLLSSDKNRSGASSTMASPVQASNNNLVERSPESADEASQMSSIHSAASDDDCVIMEEE
ncbi:microphthalmia-associated transcription factor-like isoform X2 [Rhopilema esculentum]|uniref:microphthalmia-associated transcription factor-like isoform X2 n=1 Tax=Rhopilema esculentum TaxID=499914 RepID=UPI0031E377C3